MLFDLHPSGLNRSQRRGTSPLPEWARLGKPAPVYSSPRVRLGPTPAELAHEGVRARRARLAEQARVSR